MEEELFQSEIEKSQLESLAPVWWILDREPEMDDLYEKAGASLDEMVARLKIYPFQDLGEAPRLFLARYEFPAYGQKFQHPDGVFLDDVRGFIDFLGGFPIECVEMLVLVGEHSTKADKVAVKPGGDGATSPMPKELFKWPDEGKVLLNVLYLATDNAQWMADNLEGEPEPQGLHWWVRANLTGEGIFGKIKFPIPGEFLGLGVRLMPGESWGKQRSSPFIYSGQWMDTVYYTSAVVKEVIEPDDDFPFPRYTVQWRKDEVTAIPSDFAEYQVGDRVTILKDVATEKTTQRWKDEDMTEFGENWMIAPISFYEQEKEQEG